MSLYGLDLIESSEGRRYLMEINGIRSGMSGFKHIYGDDRVQKKVNAMLQKKYGRITVNDGTFSRGKSFKEHPVKSLLVQSLLKNPRLYRLFFPLPPILHSPQAEIDWLNEIPKKDKTGLEHFEIYEKYDGSESSVINIFNELVLGNPVNNYVTEEITRNKFLQYVLLRNSEISEMLIPSTFVGLGITHKNGLINLITSMENKKFVIKPILGSQGIGVEFLDRNMVSVLYEHDEQKIQYADSKSLLGKLMKNKEYPEYLEDMVETDNFTFEYGISIIQPFIESRKTDEKVYSSVRAIVCNGNFVDAYKRVSANPKVNLSQNAAAIPFDYDSSFADSCESIIGVFEEKSLEQNSNSFRKDLYQRYMESIGRPIPRWKSDLEKDILNIFFDVMSMYVQKHK